MDGCGAQLNAVAFGEKSVRCESQTGYAFFGILLLPTADKITKICANADCLAVMAAIRAELPKECKTTHSNHQLYGQILTPIQDGCSKTPATTAPTPIPATTPPAPPTIVPAPAPPTSTMTPATTPPIHVPDEPATPSPSSASTAAPTSTRGSRADGTSPTAPPSSTSGPAMATTSPWTPPSNTSTPHDGTSSLVSNSDSNTNGISIASIAGILAVVLVLGGLVALFVVRSRKRRRQQPPDPVTPGECLERAVYGIANSGGDTTTAKYTGDQTSTTMTATGGSRGSDRLTGTNSNATTRIQDFDVRAGPGAIGLWADRAIQAARVPFEKVTCGEVLSRGAFGEVLRGSFHGQQVAIKRLLPERCKDMAEIEAFLAEAKLMTTLHHPRVVRLIGVAWDSLSDLCIVAEFMDGGDLRSMLSQYDTANHPTGFNAGKLQIAMHVVHALSYLHGLQPSVVHRDLKSKNVLLTSGGLDAKLTDFGVSRERGDATMTAGVGSSLWMAPEVMVGDRYDSKADIFSFGVLLSELDTQLMPYAHATEPGTDRKLPEMAILQLVAMGRMSVAFSGNADAEIVEMARACVALEPAERPTANELLHRLHHRWHEASGLV